MRFKYSILSLAIHIWNSYGSLASTSDKNITDRGILMDEGTLTPIYYLLYSLAFGAELLAFLMTSMQKLRLLIALSSTSYALYYYFYPAEPFWLDVGAEVILVLINLCMLVYLAWSNSRVRFDQRESFLYVNEFSELSRFEFRKLLNISEWHLEGPDFTYIQEGQTVTDIYYLISGHAQAKLMDGNIIKLPQGNVFGEVSYRLRCPATATVSSTEPCMCLRWNQEELRALCARNINIKRAVDNVLSSHMARKLSELVDKGDARKQVLIEPG